MSYSKVRAITRVATVDNEATLVELALHATASQLERSVRAYRSVLALGAGTETEVANAQHIARYFRFEWADDGSLEGRFRLPPEAGALLLKSIEAARSHVPTDPDEECSAEHPREPAATNSDALMLLAETFLANAAPESGGGDRFQIVILTGADVLADDDADGRCKLDDGPAVAPETVRRIMCDASIVEAVDRAVARAWKKAPAIPASTRTRSNVTTPGSASSSDHPRSSPAGTATHSTCLTSSKDC